MSDYAELRAALEKGPTDGKWSIGDSDLPVSRLSIHAVDGQKHTTIARMVKSEHRVWCAGEFEATWKFIAAANPDTIRALLAERDALADALMAIEGMYEYDMPVGEAAMALYEASNIARAALAQGEV